MRIVGRHWLASSTSVLLLSSPTPKTIFHICTYTRMVAAMDCSIMQLSDVTHKEQHKSILTYWTNQVTFIHMLLEWSAK